MSAPASSSSIEKEKRFDAASSAILLLAISLILLALGQLIYRLGLPSEGWSAQTDYWGPQQQLVFADSLTDAPSPLQKGDVLLAVEGQSVQEILRRALTFNPMVPARWAIGQTVDYTVSREGQATTIPVLLSARPAWRVTSSILGTLVSDPSTFPALLIGLFVFVLRPRNAAARLLLLLTTCFFASDGISHSPGGLLIGVADLFYVGAYWPALFFNQLIWPFVIAPIYVHLFLVFPTEKRPVQRYPRLTIAALYLWAPIVMLLTNVLTRGDPTTFWNAYAGFSQVDYFLILGLVVGTMIYTLVQEKGEAQQAQIRWVALGTIITSLGAIIGGVMAATNMLGQYPLLGLLLYRLPFLAFPASVAVAVLRYHLFDIDIIVNRTLVYLPLTAILAGLYAASITFTQKLFIAVSGQESIAATVFTTLIVVAAFSPLKDRLQAIVDKRFKEVHDPSRPLRAFEQQIRDRVVEVDPRQIMRRLLEEAMAAFEAKSGAAYVGSDPDLQLVENIGNFGGKAEIKTLIRTDGKQIGVVLLGPRSKGGGYSSKDSQVLGEVAEVVAVAIEEDRAEKAADPEIQNPKSKE